MAEKKRKKAARDVPMTVSRPELVVSGSDDTFRHFVHGLLAFSERVMAVRAGFGELESLSGIQYTVLVSIAHLQAREQVSVSAVASHLHLSGAFITIITNQLVALDLVRKTRHEVDRRRMVLATTPRADQLLERLAPVQRQVNDELFGPLSREQFQELARIMDGLVEAGDRAVALLSFLKQSYKP